MKNFLSALAVALLFTVASLSPSVSNAQDIKFRVNGELALPMGDFGDLASTGFGATISGEKMMDENMTLTATIGYLMWSGEEFFGITTDVSAIPVQAGLKYFFMPKSDGIRAYGMAEAGFHYLMLSAEGTIFGQTFSNDDSEVRLSLAPSVGFEMPLGDLTLDVAGRYQFVTDDTSYIGIRAGVKF